MQVVGQWAGPYRAGGKCCDHGKLRGQAGPAAGPPEPPRCSAGQAALLLAVRPLLLTSGRQLCECPVAFVTIPQPGWLKTTQIYPLSVLEVGNPKSVSLG